MFRHLLKLIWKRKSRNLMLSLEILLAFAVVFAVVAFATRSYQLYHLPVGFQHHDVWSAKMRIDGDGRFKTDPAVYDGFKRAMQALPEVERVAFASFPPYERSVMRTDFAPPGGGPKAYADIIEVSDDYFALAGMALVEGRWFSHADEGAAAWPVVINRSMAQAMFPGQSALGKQFADGDRPAANPRMLKVTGVIDDYRGHGELMTPVNIILMRFSPLSSPDGLRTIMLKVKPGTERVFEAKLNRQLKLVRNDWAYEISPLGALRASMLKSQVMPLIVLGVIAAFMLLMVAFGLFGVLWQNTTQRIPEIGLRRALGASSGHIYRQIIAEQMLLSTLAMAVALVLLVQLPITGALAESLNWKVFAAASAVSMGVIYLISLLCAVYPGWRASRLSPTEALHYE